MSDEKVEVPFPVDLLEFAVNSLLVANCGIS